MSAAILTQARKIAAAECRRLVRDRSVAYAFVIVLMLGVMSSVVTYQRHAQLQAQQSAHAVDADAQWQAQPDRHPHRVVHAGDFVFKPSSVLASLDWGVESHTGRSVFLEGHRQNTANFSEAGQGGALLRFGQLTPAMVVLQLLPLVLVFAGFGAVAGERQTGALRTLIVSGARGQAVLAGKCAALLLFALAALMSLAAALLWVDVSDTDQLLRAALLLAVYVVYLTLWCAIVTAVSSLSRSAYAALLTLLCLWVLWCVAMPRAGPSIAALMHPAPGRAVLDMRAEQALKKIGDSHNPDDPHFAAFRARTLARYGVARIEDLPVNYGGLLMLEGERLTAGVYTREVEALNAQHAEQNRFADAWGWLAPSMAAGVASRSLAGTDADHHRHFVAAAERRRYALVQSLNRMHAEKIAYQNDRGQRLHADHWDEVPREAYAVPGVEFAAARFGPALMALLLWFALSAALLAWCGQRLARSA